MPEQKTLALNVTKVEDRKSVLPKPPVLSSHQAGWKNMSLEYHIQPEYESPEHYASHYSHLAPRKIDVLSTLSTKPKAPILLRKANKIYVTLLRCF